jgi:hypothetical protein
MPPPLTYGPNHNEDIRRYVMRRDKMVCQWPGCGDTLKVEVLFLVEENGTPQREKPYYSNGITLCPKHLDVVNLHDKAFGPLVYDLVQLIEFEQDLNTTERIYKDILRQ